MLQRGSQGTICCSVRYGRGYTCCDARMSPVDARHRRKAASFALRVASYKLNDCIAGLLNCMAVVSEFMHEVNKKNIKTLKMVHIGLDFRKPILSKSHCKLGKWRSNPLGQMIGKASCEIKPKWV